MLLFDENNTPTIIDNINTPTPVDYFWVLDLNMLDFTLVPLTMTEEIICKTLELLVNGFRFNVPAKWNILILDPNTAQIDVTEARRTAGKEFFAFTYGFDNPNPYPSLISVTNFYNQNLNVGPALNKHQMLCHPVSPKSWICIAPSDPYNKFLKNIDVGDII